MEVFEITLFVISKIDKKYMVTINDNLTDEDEIRKIVICQFSGKKKLIFEVFFDGKLIQWIDLPKLLPFSTIELKYIEEIDNSDSKLIFRDKKITNEKTKAYIDKFDFVVMNKVTLIVHSTSIPCEFKRYFQSKNCCYRYQAFLSFDDAKIENNATLCARCYGWYNAGILGALRCIKI